VFLYLLSISLLFHLVLIAVFGVAFQYSGSLWFLFIVEVPRCGWDWTIWLVKVSWLGKLVFWWVELISSVWSAMRCPVVSFEMSMGLV